MTQTVSIDIESTTNTPCDPAAAVTKTLLVYGMLAGPLYILVVGIQALTRRGFDVGRHAASLLSNGELGWIQITTFTVTGLMSLAAAVGMRRAMGTGRGRTWGPRLVGLWGVGLLAAAAFRADPMDGFPVGTPDGVGAVSWHGAAHMLAGMVGFFALIAACLVVARHFLALGQRRWGAYSAATGVAFLAALTALAAAAGSPVAALALWIGVALAWVWLTALAGHFYGATG